MFRYILSIVMYVLPSGIEGEPLFSNLSEGYRRDRLELEFRRMLMAGFLPPTFSQSDLSGYRDMAVEWLDVFTEADAFVAENQNLITGAEVLSDVPLIPATRRTRIVDAFLHFENPPKYIYDRASFYSNGDNPASKALRKTVLNSLFIDPGSIAYFKYPRHGIFVDDSVIEQKYPNRGFIRLDYDSPYASEKSGYWGYLLFSPNLRIGFSHGNNRHERMSESYFVELTSRNSTILMMLDKFDTVDIASMITRKVTVLPDGSIDVRTIRFHPYPVMTRYLSLTNEIKYAVPFHLALGNYSVIPGTNSPNALEIPLNPLELETFAF